MQGAGGGTGLDMTRMTGDLDLNSVDRILDRTVALGYGWPGYVARRSWWPEDPAPDSMVDQRVLITGATSGIGRAAAARCAELGATVHLLGHNTTRATEAPCTRAGSTLPASARISPRSGRSPAR